MKKKRKEKTIVFDTTLIFDTSNLKLSFSAGIESTRVPWDGGEKTFNTRYRKFQGSFPWGIYKTILGVFTREFPYKGLL